MEYKRNSIFVYINNLFSRGFNSFEELDEFYKQVFDSKDDWHEIKNASNGFYEYKIYVNYKECQSSFTYWKTWTGLKDKDNDYIFYGDELIDSEGVIWHIQDTPDDYPYCKDGWYLIHYPENSWNTRKHGIDKDTKILNDYKICKRINEKFN